MLNNKLALITGGARGLGAAIAKGFLVHGAKVIVCDIDEQGAARAASELSGGNNTAWGEKLDVSDRGAVAAFAKRVLEQYGNIDILINNAGIGGRFLLEADDAPIVWDRSMNVNLDGTFDVSRAFIASLKATKGSIVNIASVCSFAAGTSSAGYVVSKAGVRALTQVLARDLAPYGIRVNAVAPGVMRTEMAAPQIARPHGTDWFMNRVMMQRIGEPDEIIGPVVFLASEMASYITGAVLAVDGGFLAA